MTKGRHALNVFVSAKLKAELQAYTEQAKCSDHSTHSLLVKKVSRLDLKAQAVKAVAERS